MRFERLRVLAGAFASGGQALIPVQCGLATASMSSNSGSRGSVLLDVKQRIDTALASRDFNVCPKGRYTYSYLGRPALMWRSTWL